MMGSYQPLIWTTCWLNPNLTTLKLEMGLEPLFNLSANVPYSVINDFWSCKPIVEEVEEPEYLGHHGVGQLHEEFGCGEYLDTQAIKTAQLTCGEHLPPSNLRYLPIKKLTLMNFVVDSGPILRWFDPAKLEEITFKEGCIDTGFRLTENMKHVKVQSPMPEVSLAPPRVVRPGELKIVDLKKGKVVSRVPATAANIQEAMQSKPQEEERPFMQKLNQLLPKLGKKDSKRNKENKTAGQGEGGGNQAGLETSFNQIDINKAKEGKRPVRYY